MEGLSVIVCCYNSALRLPKTIEHLGKQVVSPEIQWEVVLVDNNSSDNTVEVAKQEWDKYNLDIKLKIVKEVTPGLSFARYKGVKSSTFDYVVFCDDDNWLENNYIDISFEVLNTNKSVSAVGGKISPVSDCEFPFWWNEQAEHYAVGNQLNKSGLANQRKYLWGAGLILRKADYLFVSQQESLLQDRKGNELSSGGDSEICARLLLCGKDLFYCDKLHLKHFISKNRLTEKYLKKLLIGHRESFRVIEKYWKIIQYNNLSLSVKLKRTFIIILCFQYFNRKIVKELFLLWSLPFFIDSEYKAILKFKKLM